MTDEEIIALTNAPCYRGVDFESINFSAVVPIWNRYYQAHRDNIRYRDKTEEQVASAFVKKFYKGYNNRPSVKAMRREQATFADLLIDELVKLRIPEISNAQVDFIRKAHRFSMGLENVIGSILEEYIFTKSLNYGWATCWGSCVKAVDLCHRDGRLLQIKNKSNTENSSSSAIREGTTIQKWYRMNAKTGATCWDSLNDLLGITSDADKLSEAGFRAFTEDIVGNNLDGIIKNPGFSASDFRVNI